MIEVRPVTDRHSAEALAARCSLPFRRDAYAYAAFLNDTPAAFCQFRMQKHNPLPDLLTIGTIPLPIQQKNDLLHALCIGIRSFCLQTAPVTRNPRKSGSEKPPRW